MTPTPPGRDPALRRIAAALRLALGVGVLVAVIGQAISLIVYVARGATGSLAPYARLGALYVEVFHHVDVGVRALPVGGAREASLHLGIALLTVAALGVVLLALVGRRLAAHVSGIPLVLGVAAASLAYAAVPLVLALVARGRVDLPTTVPLVRSVDVTVSALEAFIVPVALAAAALAIGGLLGLGRREDRSPGDAAIADVVGGGIRSFAVGLALSIVGVLVFAIVQPSFVGAYGSVVTAPRALQGQLAVAGHLALMAPNQAVWLLVPAMGASDEAVLDVRPVGGSGVSTHRETSFLSYSVVPTRAPIDRGGVTSPALRRPSAALLAFLVVPLLATIGGGMRAGRDGSTPLRRSLLGAASGAVFGAFVAVAIALSRIDVALAAPFLGTSTVRIALGPALVPGALLGAAWGIVGGAIGGLVPRR